jgi:hypothetical protein
VFHPKKETPKKSINYNRYDPLPSILKRGYWKVLSENKTDLANLNNKIKKSNTNHKNLMLENLRRMVEGDSMTYIEEKEDLNKILGIKYKYQYEEDGNYRMIKLNLGITSTISGKLIKRFIQNDNCKIDIEELRIFDKEDNGWILFDENKILKLNTFSKTYLKFMIV